jgi:hypothetical protein
MSESQIITIHVDAESPTQTITASISGLEGPLDRDNRAIVYQAIHDEGVKLISVRAWRRRFRAPVEIHFLTESDTAEKLVGLLQAEDARGRKATVRVEIAR